MKKTLLSLLSLTLAAASFAQAPRVQLYEVFSGENCGPCASANPATHTLLTANPTSIIGLKYQVPIPSAGPIHLQNPTDPNARRTYYGVNAAPNARHDGTTIGNGHSINLTQALITQRQAVTSPFTIQLEHDFNATWDSVFITMTITAAQALSSGTWFARIALIEKHMSYTTPPGSNGETDFYSVARKLLPTPAGTALPSTWTNGQVQTVTIAAPVPTFIRDLAEVAVVAFVQNDVTKEVAQAAKTEPKPIPLNSKIEYQAGAFYVCDANLTPSVNIINQGTTPITSLEIRQTVGTQVQTINWTGNLAPAASTNVNLNATTLAAGRSNYEFKILTMNGQPHLSAVRSTVTGSLFLGGAPVNNVTNSFAGSFPPAGFALNNGTSTNGWALATLGANGTTRSARINFYDIGAGETDDMYLPRMDFSQAGANTELTFYVAHAQYTASTADKLMVQASTDCGATWTTLFDKSGAPLSTRAPMSGAYTSPAAAEWRMETVQVGSLAGQSSVVLRYRGVSDYGNNLFIDEINLPATVSVLETSALPLKVYPNPVNNQLMVVLPEGQQKGQFQLRNQLGQVVLNLDLQGEAGQTHAIEVGTLATGIYMAELISAGKLYSQKVVKQ